MKQVRYFIERRDKLVCDNTWSPWIKTGGFETKTKAIENFDNEFNELNKSFKMWQAGSFMGDEGYCFQYRIVNRNGTQIKMFT